MTTLQNVVGTSVGDFGIMPSGYDAVIRGKNVDNFAVESIVGSNLFAIPENISSLTTADTSSLIEKSRLKQLSDAAFSAASSVASEVSCNGRPVKKRRTEQVEALVTNEQATSSSQRRVDHAPTSISCDAEKNQNGKNSVKKGKKEKGTYGRWTAAEHEMFVAALKIYGKKWKKVANMIKTRTAVQIRTHAQKYFIKMNKALNGDGVSEGGIPLDLDGRHGGAALSLQEQAELLKAHSALGSNEDDDLDDDDDEEMQDGEVDDDRDEEEDTTSKDSYAGSPKAKSLPLKHEESTQKTKIFKCTSGNVVTGCDRKDALPSSKKYEDNPLLLMEAAIAAVEGTDNEGIHTAEDLKPAENLLEAAQLLFSFATKASSPKNVSNDQLDVDLTPVDDPEDESTRMNVAGYASDSRSVSSTTSKKSTKIQVSAEVTAAALSAMTAVVPESNSWAAYYAMEAAARAASRHSFDQVNPAGVLSLSSHSLHHNNYPQYYPHLYNHPSERALNFNDIAMQPPQQVEQVLSPACAATKSDNTTTEADEDESGSSSDSKDRSLSASIKTAKKNVTVESKDIAGVKEGNTKKYRYLSCSEKYGIIQRMKSCERHSGKQHGMQAEIAREYNVSQSTVYQILKKRDEIEFYCENELKNGAAWSRPHIQDNPVLTRNNYWHMKMGSLPPASVVPSSSFVPPHGHNRIAEFETTLTQLLNRNKIDSVAEFKSFSEWYAAHLDIKDPSGKQWQCTQEWMDNFHHYCMDISFLR